MQFCLRLILILILNLIGFAGYSIQGKYNSQHIANQNLSENDIMHSARDDESIMSEGVKSSVDDHLVGEKTIGKRTVKRSLGKQRRKLIRRKHYQKQTAQLQVTRTNSDKQPCHPFFHSHYFYQFYHTKNHPNEKFYIKYFKTMGRNRLNKDILSINCNITKILYLFSERNIPLELIVIPLLLPHSKLLSTNHDRKGAWQVTPNQAKASHIKLNWWLDERLDFEKNSQAALDHIAELKKELHDWNFVIAAYYSSKKYIKKFKNKYPGATFWQIASKKEFDPGCTEFVLQFYALLKIVYEPTKYQFPPLNFNQCDRLSYISIMGPIQIRDLEKASQLPANKISQLNPQLIKGIIPKNEFAFIRIPRKQKKQIFLAYTQISNIFSQRLAEQKPKQRKQRIGIKQTRRENYNKLHTGRTGGNFLSENDVILNEENNPPPFPMTEEPRSYQPSGVKQNQGKELPRFYQPSAVNQNQYAEHFDHRRVFQNNNQRRYRFYRIKQGDTLIKIADHFKVRLKLIFAHNPNLVIRKLIVGQLLKIPAKPLPRVRIE